MTFIKYKWHPFQITTDYNLGFMYILKIGNEINSNVAIIQCSPISKLVSFHKKKSV